MSTALPRTQHANDGSDGACMGLPELACLLRHMEGLRFHQLAGRQGPMWGAEGQVKGAFRKLREKRAFCSLPMDAEGLGIETLWHRVEAARLLEDAAEAYAASRAGLK